MIKHLSIAAVAAAQLFRSGPAFAWGDEGHEADLHLFEAMPRGGLGGSSPKGRELQHAIARHLA